jgi:hypothetical protein
LLRLPCGISTVTSISGRSGWDSIAPVCRALALLNRGSAAGLAPGQQPIRRWPVPVQQRIRAGLHPVTLIPKERQLQRRLFHPMQPRTWQQRFVRL